MDNFRKISDFLNKLEEKNIYYRLNRVRDSIMVEIAVPGERWEVEFMTDPFFEGEIVIEKFKSDGQIFDESELDKLFEIYSN